MARILVVDDDRSLVRALRVALAARGHEVISAVSGEEGLTKFVVEAPDVVILDLGLPDIDGLEVCARIRRMGGVPLIVLSATSSESRKVEALNRGADDYVTKPFGMAELEARIRATLRHRRADTQMDNGLLHVGSLDVDVIHHEVRRDNEVIALTSKEFDLLSYLASNRGKVCTHQMILRRVWGDGYGDESQYLRVYVYRLRRKLGAPEGELLRSVPGIGYALDAP